MKKLCSFALALLLISGCSFKAHNFTLENVMYIWQRSWTQNLDDSIKSISPITDFFTVLCGDLKYQDNKPSISTINIDWAYFAKTEAKITLAFRISTDAGKLLHADAMATAVDAIYEHIQKIMDKAPAGYIVGIQFDYDCPTSKLNAYTDFLKLFKEKLPGVQISVTTLPTWLGDREFANLIKQTDYYVLQLHSFEVPKTLKDARDIFPENKAKSYVKKASSHRWPYYISLPTYGYEVAFDKKGKFIGLRAEGANILWRQDIQHEIEVVSPEEIIRFLQYIQNKKPKLLKGIFWFRLPIKTDEFNWDINTLISVIEGKLPKKGFEIELIEKEKGLVEVYIVNSGEQNFWGNVEFDIVWSGAQKPIYDVLGKYESTLLYDDKTIHLKGPAPKVGEKTLVSWLRIDEENVIKHGGVIYEDN
jgi:hypothetical protein